MHQTTMLKVITHKHNEQNDGQVKDKYGFNFEEEENSTDIDILKKLIYNMESNNNIVDTIFILAMTKLSYCTKRTRYFE